jgi:hypothetical protein
MTLALILLSLLVLGEAAGLLLVNDARRHWRFHDRELQAQLNLDEAELELFRGPRPGVDANDPWRAV